MAERVRGHQAEQPTSDVSAEALARTLRHADPRVLIALMAHVSGEQRFLEGRYAEICARTQNLRIGAVDTSLAESIVEEAVPVIGSLLTRAGDQVHSPGDEFLLRIFNVVAGRDEPGCEYLPKILDELGLSPVQTISETASRSAGQMTVAVVGAGPIGLLLASRLQAVGFDYYVIEKNDEIGGTWWENCYPDCGVDTPAHRYLFSREPIWTWSSYFAKRGEVLEHLQRFAHKFNLRHRILLRHTVEQMTFDSDQEMWHIRCRTDGQQVVTLTANVVVTAVGGLNNPKMPDIPDLDLFEGDLVHTARWRSDLRVQGQRVGLIGNGSSGVQIAKSLAESAASLTVFQRTPHWIRPNPDVKRPVTDEVRWLMRYVPLYAEWYRLILYWTFGDKLFSYLSIDPQWQGPGPNARNQALRSELCRYISSQVDGRTDLLDKLVPSYPPYTKRMVIDNDYYRTLTRPNVALVTDPICRADRRGLVTAESGLHQLDAIVAATGFENGKFLWPIEVRTRRGRTASEAWGGAQEARAYLGVAMSEFPNFFMTIGPNSAPAHGGSGVVDSGESQVDYIVSCLTAMAKSGFRLIEVKNEICEEYNRELDARIAEKVWTVPGVMSRYKNPEGRVITNHPWSLLEYWLMTREVDLSDYHTA